jgi:hypothetical protein
MDGWDRIQGTSDQVYLAVGLNRDGKKEVLGKNKIFKSKKEE